MAILGPGAPVSQPPGLVSVATQTPPQGAAQVQSEAGQEASQEVPASTPAPGKKGKKVKPEKPGKAVVTAGEVAQPRPVLTPLTIPGASAPGSDTGTGGHPVPPTPSPQQGDALFAFPPVLAL